MNSVALVTLEMVKDFLFVYKARFFFSICSVYLSFFNFFLYRFALRLYCLYFIFLFLAYFFPQRTICVFLLVCIYYIFLSNSTLYLDNGVASRSRRRFYSVNFNDQNFKKAIFAFFESLIIIRILGLFSSRLFTEQIENGFSVDHECYFGHNVTVWYSNPTFVVFCLTCFQCILDFAITCGLYQNCSVQNVALLYCFFFSLMLTRYKDNTEEATRIVYAVVNYAPYQNAFNVQDRGNTQTTGLIVYIYRNCNLLRIDLSGWICQIWSRS